MRGHWRRFSVIAAFIGAVLSAGCAHAQSAVQQYGPITVFHVPYYIASSQVGDGGTPSSPFLSALGLFNGSGCPLGVSSQSSPGTVTTPYSLFTVCNTGGAVRFTFAGVNGQATPAVYFNIGGVDYPFPFSGPGSGVLSLNGISGIANITAGSGITVTPSGQNISIAATGGGGGGSVTSVATDTTLTGGPITTSGTLSRAALTGDVTAAGGSNATTLATVNGNVGTWGSTTAIPNFTVNGKGLTTAAGQTTLTAALDAAFSSSQGSVLYRGASAWSALAPGTNGFVLQTQGPAANPQWVATSGGGGTVTSVTCNGGLTGGTFTSTGTCSLNSPTSHGVLIGQGASAIAATSAGTTGQVLTSNGASADPTFQALPAGQAPLATIAALRALTSANTAAQQNVLGYTTTGIGGGVFVYVASDVTSADDNCTIFVDASSRRWYRQYSGAVNVQWCGALGNGVANDTTAIGYALSGFQNVYIPATSSFYAINGTLTIAKQGQNVHGDGPGSTQGGGPSGGGTIIQTSSASLPVFRINAGLYAVQLSNMLLDRSTTATAGGNGVDSLGGDIEVALISNVVVQHHYYGFALGPTSNGTLQNCVATNNQNTGVYMLGTASNGVLQWSMYSVFSTTNGTVSLPADGFSATATSGAGVSLGTIYGGGTFANTGHGYAAYGVSATYPVSGVRIVGGFFGQDNNDEIYLNTYGGLHVIEPVLLELAGTSASGVGLAVAASQVGAGVNVTSNNVQVYIGVGTSNGNSYDGVNVAASMSGSHVIINGGVYSNNGQGTGAVGAGRANGINIFNASSVSVSGVSAYGNRFGISSNVDVMSVAGSDFNNNSGSYSAFPALSASCIAGSRPVAINSCGGSVGPFLPLAGGTMSGAIAMGSNNISGVGTLTATTVNTTNLGATTMTGNLALGSNNITGVNNLTVAGAIATGGQTLGVAGDINTTTLHVQGASAFVGGINVTGVGIAISPGAGQLIADNATLRVSLGVGGNATNNAGELKVFGTLFNQAGSWSFTNTGASISAIGVNTAIPATGVINVTSAVQLNGTPYTNP